MIIPSSITENAYNLILVDSPQIIPRTASNDINLGDNFILLLHIFSLKKIKSFVKIFA